VPFAKSEGAEIYYEVHGEGPAVLFVHGSGGHHAAWWQQTPYFTKRGYSVVTLDLRGFGRSTSELEEYDSLEFPRDILAVLDDAGIDKAVLVGQSIGAAAALKVAVAHPDRVAGVVLAHSLGGLDNPELADLVKADRAEAEKLPVIDRLMSKSFQEQSPELTFLFRQMGTFNKAKMQDLRNLTAGGPTLDTLAGLGVPICFLAGENDAVIRPATIRRAHELVGGSVLELIPEAPHSMYWEAPALFNGGIERFLKTVYA
jgi:pimeloyl-ACP methyl ester carboxylesterase